MNTKETYDIKVWQGILECKGIGMTNKEVAEHLNISSRYVTALTDYSSMIEVLRDEAAMARAGDGNRMVSSFALDALADAIEELSEPRWIPVTEQLPNYPGRYMCYYEVNDYEEIGHCIDWGRYDPDGGWYVSGVTHWMPLPEPPKEC